MSARTTAGRRLRLAPLWWIAPAGCVTLFVFGYSLFALVDESLHYKGSWVGVENYGIVLSDPLFRTAILHNLLLLLAVPVLVALAFVLAVLLFETRKGMRFYRATVFLPYVLPVPAVAVVLGQMLQLHGAVNELLGGVGLSALAKDWLGSPDLALWTMAGIIIWKEFGFGVVLLLSAMLSLPRDVFEAAALDGAGFWRTHLSVTLPQIRPAIVFFGITEAIVMVSWVFNYVYVLTNGQGGPGDATMVSELYIYRAAFANTAPELGAAAAVSVFAGTLVLVVAFFRLQRRSVGSMFEV